MVLIQYSQLLRQQVAVEVEIQIYQDQVFPADQAVVVQDFLLVAQEILHPQHLLRVAQEEVAQMLRQTMVLAAEVGHQPLVV
ncbi:MAG: hypothetical protein EBR82_74290, partial [Caulobacteraceae bacterium]|nr:hypothetical protein [Caulobacteraceae bacterium]